MCDVNQEFMTEYSILDRLFEKIPGYDGWSGYLEDDAFNNPAMNVQRTEERLNTAFYHRFYEVSFL